MTIKITGRILSLLALAGLGLLGCPTQVRGQTTPDGWRLVFADNFNRETLGPNWRWSAANARWGSASGRQSVHENAVRLSQSSIVYCVVPLPFEQVRAEMDILLPAQAFSGPDKHALILELRSGEYGGGGNSEWLEVRLIPATQPGNPAADPAGTFRIALDQPCQVVMQISDGIGSLTINGKALWQTPVPPLRSEINRFFVLRTEGLNGAPGKEAALDNFKIFAGPKAVAKLPLLTNTPEENRQATRKAADFLDPANPAPGIQKAIDSLPPAGGLVILPEGEFLMRRHLTLRHNVTLAGQGAGKTILKAVPCIICPIQNIKSNAGQCVVTLATNDAAKFRPGDGVCFNGNWSHPCGRDRINMDCFITAVAGNQITVKGLAPAAPRTMLHWFPMVYAICTEFVEVKDLTIIGGDGGNGGFESAAITFGRVAGTRIARVHIPKWLGDGISLQFGAESIWTDNTVSGTAQGYHPGTYTQRFLWTRNLGLGNRSCGLYFCFFNQNGMYHLNTLDRFDGYAWPDDSFNVITRNVCRAAFAIEQGEGGGGVIFNNQFPNIVVGHGNADAPTRDFLVADNRANGLSYRPGAIERNMIVGNLTLAGDKPMAIAAKPDKNFFFDQGVGLDLQRFPIGLTRTAPVAPPALPKPVLDGAEFYRPQEPDAGFQAGLNKLAQGGGTFLLPAGRYGLAQPLTVPSGVTLAGRGLATVLHAAKPEQNGSLIVVKPAEQATVCDLVILGEYGRRAVRSPAIVFQDVKKAELAAVDVRGWEGTAVKIAGGRALVRECRALGCAGNGFELSQCQVNCLDNIARECASGFVISRSSPDSLLEANIAGGNRGNGYRFEQCAGIRVYANNAHLNDENGLLLENTEKAEVVANMLAKNNQAYGEGCGIRLAGNSRDCRLYYNNCQDPQLQPSQTRAIVEDKPAGGNLLRFNLDSNTVAQAASPPPPAGGNPGKN